MTIRTVVEGDRAEWLRMRDALWPGSRADHDAETRTYFETREQTLVVFVAESGGRLVGFLELDFRRYAPGCSSSPVPFIEGWYVDPNERGKGVGRALMAAAETHAHAAGHHELASDAELDNKGGIAAHRAVGFEEIERTVSFRRSLG